MLKMHSFTCQNLEEKCFQAEPPSWIIKMPKVSAVLLPMHIWDLSRRSLELSSQQAARIIRPYGTVAVPREPQQ